MSVLHSYNVYIHKCWWKWAVSFFKHFTPNGTTFNDLVWPLTPISRSQYFSTFNVFCAHTDPEREKVFRQLLVGIIWMKRCEIGRWLPWNVNRKSWVWKLFLSLDLRVHKKLNCTPISAAQYGLVIPGRFALLLPRNLSQQYVTCQTTLHGLSFWLSPRHTLTSFTRSFAWTSWNVQIPITTVKINMRQHSR